MTIARGLDPTVGWTCHLLLAAVFARSGWAKLRDPAAFTRALRGYAIVPERGVAPAAAALLAFECLLVPGLLAPAVARTASLLAAFALIAYAVAIAINLVRGRRDIDCGCAGPVAHQSLHEWLIARNAAYVLLALAGALPPAARDLGAIDGFTVAMATATLLALSIATDQLAALAARTHQPESPR